MRLVNTRSPIFTLLLILMGSIIMLFIISPLLGMFLKTSGFELFEAASDEEVRMSISRTLLISFLSTFGFAILAIPFAYLLARKEFHGKRLVNAIIDLPIVIPHSAAGIALLGFISRDSAIGRIAESLGINLVGHPVGIALAMAFVSIPFLINAARDGFQAVPVRLEKAAYNLGAPPATVFFTVSLPLAWRSVLTGIILMFGRGMSEFGAVVIVAYHPMITPVLIYERFSAYGLSNARPISVIFIIICLLFFVGLRLLSMEKKKSIAKDSSIK
jgi:molybdate/tungstate transport system permease protein